jgi:hypothetical protein
MRDRFRVILACHARGRVDSGGWNCHWAKFGLVCATDVASDIASANAHANVLCNNYIVCAVLRKWTVRGPELQLPRRMPVMITDAHNVQCKQL